MPLVCADLEHLRTNKEVEYQDSNGSIPLFLVFFVAVGSPFYRKQTEHGSTSKCQRGTLASASLEIKTPLNDFVWVSSDFNFDDSHIDDKSAQK